MCVCVCVCNDGHLDLSKMLFDTSLTLFRY